MAPNLRSSLMSMSPAASQAKGGGLLSIASTWRKMTHASKARGPPAAAADMHDGTAIDAKMRRYRDTS